MVGAPEVYKKIVGMQMLVEGLAMGAFATLYQKLAGPARWSSCCQLVMTDEAFHHKFGKIWADRTIPKLSRKRHEPGRRLGGAMLPDPAVQPRQSPSRCRSSTSEFGLDPAGRARRDHGSLWRRQQRREDMKQAANIFRVLIKTLLNAGIITDRTRGFYGMYVDMDELKNEGTRMVGDDIAEEGIKLSAGHQLRRPQQEREPARSGVIRLKSTHRSGRSKDRPFYFAAPLNI